MLASLARSIALAVAIGLVAVTGACSSGGGTQGGKTSSLLPLLGPAGLAAKTEPFAVTLTWTQPARSAKVKSYGVYRDGSLLGTVDVPRTDYVDSAVSPGKSYSYEVVAYDARERESDRASVSVETPTPPLADARIDGKYDVNAKIVSKYGYTRGPGNFTMGWRLTARCDSGACDVLWTDAQGIGIKAVLHRKGGQYSGTERGRFIAECGDTLTVSTLTLKLRVAKATGLAGEWRASRLKGTFVEREAPQLGCVSSGADYTITATLIP